MKEAMFRSRSVDLTWALIYSNTAPVLLAALCRLTFQRFVMYCTRTSALDFDW